MRRSRPLDEALDAVSHPQRRKLLISLLDHNPQDDSPATPVDDREATDVELRVEMEQVHLPELEARGFVTRDRENSEVAKGPEFTEIRPLLELLDDHKDELPPGWL